MCQPLIATESYGKQRKVSEEEGLFLSVAFFCLPLRQSFAEAKDYLAEDGISAPSLTPVRSSAAGHSR